jgi:pimeloyl-ACP methyl ester carboxylesterase
MEQRSGRGPVEPPSPLLRLAESRAVFEFGAFVATAPWLRRVGRGDRHPVLVLPGFTASDRSTVALRSILASQGYWAHGWQLGQNLGPTDEVLDGIQSRLESLHVRHGRPVSIVGWSLGGIYARELARQHPDRVRLVVTLGSPFRMTAGDRSAASALFDSLKPGYNRRFLDLVQREREKPPLPVPSTAVYSRTDGVVRWHTCIDEVRDEHENIEVRGSHSGLGWNPAAVFAISDRLAQPEGRWKPFHPPLPLRPWYPPAATWLGAA